MSIHDEKQRQFLVLFEPVRQRLSHYVQAMVYNRDDARDIVSDTITIAYERFTSLHTPQSFVFFLFTIARRLYTKRRWRQRLFFPLVSEHAELAHGAASPDALADVQLLYAALEKLPLKHREAVALFYLSGLSIEQVRAIQGGTLSGVKSRLRRGKQQLAVLLGAEDDTGDPPNAPQQQEHAQAWQPSTEQQQLDNWFIAHCSLSITGNCL